MKKLFLGLVFVLINISLTIDTMRIDILPNVIGYGLMFYELRAMAGEVPSFDKARPIALGLTIYTAFLFAVDTTGVSADMDGWLTLLLGLIVMVVCIYITYLLLHGLQELEQKYRTNLNSKAVEARWLPMAGFQALSYLMLFLPLVSLICLIAAIVFAVLFLLEFHGAVEEYETVKPVARQREEDFSYPGDTAQPQLSEHEENDQ